MKTIEDGIYDNISIEDYHANRSHVSATTIKYAKKSLKHYQWFRDGRIAREDKSQFGFGNAFELALLAPAEYLEKVAVLPDDDFINEAQAIAKRDGKQPFSKPRSSKYYQDKHDTFMFENRSRYIINQTGAESFETIEEMLSSCYQDSTIQDLIKNTEYQLSLFWTDPATGIKLKTRPDICKRKKNVIVNLKTTLDGSPQAFSNALNKWDYPLQAVIEASGCLQTNLMDSVDSYFWLVVEKVAPFNATIYEFNERDMAAVRDNLSYVLSRIKKAQDQNIWPGYGDAADNKFGILTATMPPWYRF